MVEQMIRGIGVSFDFDLFSNSECAWKFNFLNYFFEIKFCLLCSFSGPFLVSRNGKTGWTES